MKDFEIKLKGFGRMFGGYPDILRKSDVIAWKSAENLLSKFEYSENSSKITLFFDWSEVVQEAEEGYRLESMSKEELEKWTPSRSELERYPKVLCKIHLNSQNLTTDSSIGNRYWAYALRAIYESFIILNLSSPAPRF
jgi:hypothetical protein